MNRIFNVLSLIIKCENNIKETNIKEENINIREIKNLNLQLIRVNNQLKNLNDLANTQTFAIIVIVFIKFVDIIVK